MEESMSWMATKNFAKSGWRVGWKIIAPDGDRTNDLQGIQSNPIKMSLLLRPLHQICNFAQWTRKFNSLSICGPPLMDNGLRCFAVESCLMTCRKILRVYVLFFHQLASTFTPSGYTKKYIRIIYFWYTDTSASSGIPKVYDFYILFVYPLG